MITIKKKEKIAAIPKYNSHSGFSRENWNSLNANEEVKVEAIPEVAKQFVEQVKSKGK
tara:strand:- start:364 stop:537 length:174 start_codon:yes stop_codon:yes gene_type:complete